MAAAHVAIVHDYLTQRGGAERVVLAMLRALPDARLYTALYEPSATYAEFSDFDVRTLWTSRIAALRADHRRGLPIYPGVFTQLRVDADVTVCSSSGFAHGVRASGRKVVYCHTPARWLYEESRSYLSAASPAIRIGLRAIAPALRRWDRRAATGADVYLTNAQHIRDRIERTYGIRAQVLPPGVDVDVHRPKSEVPGLAPGFILCVARLVSYKHVSAIVGAFERLPDLTLVVVGDGPERSILERSLPSNVRLLGSVTDAELAWLYANCAGFVAASREDFGLTPLEAAAFGKPAAVLRFGGFLDTVVEGETGVFFDSPEAGAIAAAIRALLAHAWSSDRLEAQAQRFSNDVFAEAFRAAIL